MPIWPARAAATPVSTGAVGSLRVLMQSKKFSHVGDGTVAKHARFFLSYKQAIRGFGSCSSRRTWACISILQPVSPSSRSRCGGIPRPLALFLHVRLLVLSRGSVRGTERQLVEAELSMVKNRIHEFEALHPNVNEWTSQQVAHYDSLTARQTDIRAKDAELGVCRPHG